MSIPFTSIASAETVTENDYLSQTLDTLHRLEVPDCEYHAECVQCESFTGYCRAFVDSFNGLELFNNGFHRFSARKILVSSTIDLGYDINGEMLDWWFSHVDNTEKYVSITSLHPSLSLLLT